MTKALLHYRSAFGIGLLLASLPSAGCATLVALSSVEKETVVARTHPRTAKVRINSEPAGATIIRDGAASGTTPAALDFDYGIQERKKRCWALLPAGLLDMAAGGAGIFASYKGFGGDTSGEAFIVSAGMSAAYAAFGLIGVLGPAAGCYSEEPDPLPVPRDYPLQLRKGEWEETLVVRVPLASRENELSAVFRQLERADWQRAESENTLAAYGKYLRSYPSGAWRKEAEYRQDAATWQAASKQDSVSAYQEYVREFRFGRWRREAEARMERILWQKAEASRSDGDYSGYLFFYPHGKWATSAENAILGLFENSPDRLSVSTLSSLMSSHRPSLRARSLEELLRRQAVDDVTSLLSDRVESPTTRRQVLDLLVEVARPPEPSQRRTSARAVLCRFAASKSKVETPSAEDCRYVRRADPLLSLDLNLTRYTDSDLEEEWREPPDPVKQCKWHAQDQATLFELEASLRKAANQAAQCGGK